MRFAKGHGTGNDFLILPDPDNALVLEPPLVASLCDRRTGLGADGILRAVRGSGSGRDAAAGWFMDYRNADGSPAEMCGNGIRVFARYLLDRRLAAGPGITVATRAGLRKVREEPDGQITVDMGVPAVLGRAVAVISGKPYPGLAVSLGNPHLACVVDRPVAGFDLSAPPELDHGQFPGGANVEVAQVRGPGRLDMRVYERGSGATQSCGTGAVAAAVAAAMAGTDTETAAKGAGTRPAAANGAGPAPAGRWTVDVPGGRLLVTLGETTSLLTGPAVIVADGELNEAWLASQAAARRADGTQRKVMLS